ncbi:MAG TPA: Lrp/AsnC family transcriptional regulator [Ktedonobacteraceae bacterium]|jgi:Lrp/AsnC family leucine-responsive transcriptional regulator|nr:Lrp/AsnC family transcriptional regulator [Ktedonobacteraceae bacterium]
MDTTDQAIVRLLLAQGRISHEQLAQEVHLSRPAVHERIKRLQEEKILRGYKAVVDWGALGLPLSVFIWVRGSGTARETGRVLLQLSNSSALIEECHSVTGEWCVMLKARVADSHALETLIEQIRAIEGIQGTFTSLVLSTISEGQDAL